MRPLLLTKGEGQRGNECHQILPFLSTAFQGVVTLSGLFHLARDIVGVD